MKKFCFLGLITLWGLGVFCTGVFAADKTIYTSDSTYIVNIDDMDGTGYIYKQDPFFDIITEDNTIVEIYEALYLDASDDIAPFFSITTYKGGISNYDKIIFKTENSRYTYELSQVSASLTDDKSGLSINLYLFDKHSMELVKEIAESNNPVPFRIVCSGETINGTIAARNKEDVLAFYNDYESAGGFNQNFFEKYSDAGNYLCNFVDLTEQETSTENVEDVDISYDDKLVIAVIQQALTQAGFDSGKADGIIGSKTTTAISNFQKEMGLEVTGSITDELVEKLNISNEVQKAARKEASKGNYSSDVSYEQLSRNPDVYNNMKLTFRGKVLQDIDEGNGRRGLRLAVNSNYDQVIYVFYDNDLVGYRILEDDQITVYGLSAGIFSYTSTTNRPVSIPAMNADIIEIHY